MAIGVVGSSEPSPLSGGGIEQLAKWSARLWIAGTIALLFLCGTSVAKAEDGEIARLRKEVETLKRTVEHLDVRVESLERRPVAEAESTSQEPVAPPAPPKDSPSPTAPDRAIKDRWRSIRHGMTLEQVEALLGRPQRTVALSSGTVWHYSYPDIGSGSVVFALDGTIIDWQPPPSVGAWWPF